MLDARLKTQMLVHYIMLLDTILLYYTSIQTNYIILLDIVNTNNILCNIMILY